MARRSCHGDDAIRYVSHQWASAYADATVNMSARNTNSNLTTADLTTADLTTTDIASEIGDRFGPASFRTSSHTIPDTTTIEDIMHQYVYRDVRKIFYDELKKVTDAASPTTPYADLEDMASASARRLVAKGDVPTPAHYENIFINVINSCERRLPWYKSPQEEFRMQLDRQLPDSNPGFDLNAY